MKRYIKRLIQRLPLGKEMLRARDLLLSDRNNPQFVLPGHYYSPIPDLEQIRACEERIFSSQKEKVIPGIDLNENAQLNLLEKFRTYYPELPFTPEKREHWRYYFDNRAYTWADAIYLYCMIRYLEPEQILEVGSGFSSCVILDTNEKFMHGAICCRFIDPFPQSLFSLLKAGDKERIEIIARPVQDIDLDMFRFLSPGDILLIDSTHVSKVGSDVNYLIFEVLPALESGVYIHFHDVFFPFEYPKEWIYAGTTWNEAYTLRAFLQFNRAFEIVLFSSYLGQFCADYLNKHMPLCLKNSGGSIWLRKR